MTERLDGSDGDKPPFIGVRCPLPECEAELHITWHASRPIFMDDTAADLSDPREGYTSTWEVGCTQGHVVLLPPDTASDSYTFGACDNCPESPVQDPASAAWCGHSDLDRLRRAIGLAVKEAKGV